MECLFCKIINKEINSYTIYEDQKLIVFLDIYPEADGHMLIVPKKHIHDLNDLDDETTIFVMNKAKDMRKLLEERLHIDGLRLIQNNGIIQDIKHYHLHLKPYYSSKLPLSDVKEIYDKLK